MNQNDHLQCTIYDWDHIYSKQMLSKKRLRLKLVCANAKSWLFAKYPHFIYLFTKAFKKNRKKNPLRFQNIIEFCSHKIIRIIYFY